MLGTLENLLNRGLPRSIRARTLCAALAGRSFALEAEGLARLRIASNGATLTLALGDVPADAACRGGPFTLLALLGPAREATLRSGAVTVSGDAQLAEQFAELLALLRPDPEEELSLLTGDVAAHRLGGLARAGVDFTRRAASTGLRNLAEYLAHERRDLVPRTEAESFLRGVDTLREDLDRLQARLALLEARRGPRSAPAP
ncbi:MAG: hypothetical protein JO341_09595 [Gammaproteobacteria bacterium]|nr:hypothetical protein [Gammaproteobacteria bacterium]MBV9621262.1 hypothetical protein [Gammaproteobacteria bacterium]